MFITQHISMTSSAYISLRDELAVLRRGPDHEVRDGQMDTGERPDDYRARRGCIDVIETLLARAIVENDPRDDIIAAPGTVVTIHYDDTGDVDTLILGGLGAGDDDNKIYPLRSPIGRALTGARPGERIQYTLPGGAPVALTVLKVETAA
jgi:transcription elongation GreA/GreB family factor